MIVDFRDRLGQTFGLLAIGAALCLAVVCLLLLRLLLMLLRLMRLGLLEQMCIWVEAS